MKTQLGALPSPNVFPVMVDALIVGGGISGAGIARDLAGRGLKVLLCEKDDLAAHTSSSSTKLIHGGLRYLEGYHFGLVRKALQEQEALLRSAPHIIYPLRFVMPHNPQIRPAWMIRLGIAIYDQLATRKILPKSSAVKLANHILGNPLQEKFKDGFIYSDAWVDDARLVVLNAIDAKNRGATILTRTECGEVIQRPNGWLATIKGPQNQVSQVQTKLLINASGPWADTFLKNLKGDEEKSFATKKLRLVKGSHIIVPKCFDHDHAYIFQNSDKRIMFAIPYELNYTLIGTTDIEFTGDPSKVDISAAEIDYLCEQANSYFKVQIAPNQVIGHYSGVRPLLDDGKGNPAAVTRDYVIETRNPGNSPVINVWGGKITTYRKLAEEVSNQACKLLGVEKTSWTKDTELPGGDLHCHTSTSKFSKDYVRNFDNSFQQKYPWIPSDTLSRWCKSYGTLAELVIGSAKSEQDLGCEILPGLYEAELKYLMKFEWALTPEDILWRRSKLGLHLDKSAATTIQVWIDDQAKIKDSKKQ